MPRELEVSQFFLKTNSEISRNTNSVPEYKSTIYSVSQKAIAIQLGWQLPSHSDERFSEKSSELKTDSQEFLDDSEEDNDDDNDYDEEDDGEDFLEEGDDDSSYDYDR